MRDDCGTHDFLLAPCSRDTWRLCYGGDHDDVPGCFGNLAAALAPFGIEPDAIPTAFNVFMHVEVGADGRLAVRPPRSRPGAVFAVRAEERLIVGLTACSAEQSCNGRFKPIQYSTSNGARRYERPSRVDALSAKWYASEVPAGPPWFGRFRVRSGVLSADDLPAGP